MPSQLATFRPSLITSHESSVTLRVGYEIGHQCWQDTPMIVVVSIHESSHCRLITPDFPETFPAVPTMAYRDGFGNRCHRLTAPAGRFLVRGGALVRVSAEPDPCHPNALQHPVQDLPQETLVFLLGSRYCETDRLSAMAWQLFGHTSPGWPRVQQICDFVHRRLTFNYQNADATRTAFMAFEEQTGVCRDYAHLAIAFCRCMNIPARYCTGYLSDLGTEPPWGIPDFAAWIEVYLDGDWHTFDPRNNVPRRGRILMARGRDASDVAIATTFGPSILESFIVWTEEEPEL
ncbi:MAG: transglutaminase family protein [Bryobacteraceae bacterium]|nr:transglutaminase family protein [Bryobacteraceae bacterium]